MDEEEYGVDLPPPTYQDSVSTQPPLYRNSPCAIFCLIFILFIYVVCFIWRIFLVSYVQDAPTSLSAAPTSSPLIMAPFGSPTYQASPIISRFTIYYFYTSMGTLTISILCILLVLTLPDLLFRKTYARILVINTYTWSEIATAIVTCLGYSEVVKLLKKETQLYLLCLGIGLHVLWTVLMTVVIAKGWYSVSHENAKRQVQLASNVEVENETIAAKWFAPYRRIERKRLFRFDIS